MPQGFASKLEMQNSLSARFFKDPNCTSSIGALNDVDFLRCKPLSDYYALKTANASVAAVTGNEEKTILLSGESLDFNAYSQWLNANYQLGIK